jgi:ribosomal-protein-alanine N-acetyltransferase
MNENFIKLETERLEIFCLALEDMLLLNQGNQEERFCHKMGYSIAKLDGLEKDLTAEFSRLALENEESRLWFRLWDIVSKKEKKRIGGALFKGGPNIKGEVEIGYGIDEEFQGQGFATEAVGKLVRWALEQEGVTSVIAETDKENIASQRVLQKIGMTSYSETDTGYLWSFPANSHK